MNKRILFINNFTTTSTVPELVAGAGYRVDTISSPEAAPRELDTRHYDLMILLENPFAESWAVCQRLRRQTAIPLIVISYNASTESWDKAINAGADYLITTPLGPMELRSRINSLLQRVTQNQPISLAY